MEEGLKQYELTLIFAPHLEEAALNSAQKEIEEKINGLNGSIVFKEAEKRPLAYPMNKEKQGLFVTAQVSIVPEKIAVLNHELKLNKNILRYLLNTWIPIEERSEEIRPRKTGKPKTELLKEKKKAVEEKKAKEDKKTLEEIDKKIDEIISDI